MHGGRALPRALSTTPGQQRKGPHDRVGRRVDTRRGRALPRGERLVLADRRLAPSVQRRRARGGLSALSGPTASSAPCRHGHRPAAVCYIGRRLHRQRRAAG
eukprot:7391017-Prymnesium_polylepis.2